MTAARFGSSPTLVSISMSECREFVTSRVASSIVRRLTHLRMVPRCQP